MTIIVARADIASALQRKWASERHVRIFRDADALWAFHTIATRCPTAIVLDPLFAGTSRGATLIAQVRADARLAGAEIRILIADDPAQIAALQDPAASVETVIASMSRLLDWCGTRRALRFPIEAEAPASLDGVPTQLVNLSITGVQLLSIGRLRPAQGFRLTLVDDDLELRLQAIVAWCTLQGSTSAPSYRAGAAFLDSNQRAIEAFCRRYGKEPDQLFVAPAWAAAAPDVRAEHRAAARDERHPKTRGKRR